MTTLKKIIICSAALSLSTAAMADTFQISGTVDMMMRADNGNTAGGTTYSMQPGNASASRLTFRAMEELGGGYRAASILESGFAPNTGAGAVNPPGATGMNFGRLAFVELGSDKTGYVAMGRQYTPIGALGASNGYDPFGAGYLGGIVNFDNLTIRASNAIIYHYGYTWEGMKKPAPLYGLGIAAMFAPGGDSTAPSIHSGQQKGVAITYGTEHWWAGYAYHRIDGSNSFISVTTPTSGNPRLVEQSAGVSAVLGKTRLIFGLNLGKNDATGTAALDRLNWHVGVSTEFTPFLFAQVFYGRANDRTAANADFSTFQIGLEYVLSKRTMLYVVAGQADNSEHASYFLPGAVGEYAPGSKSRSVATGIRHFF